jgi:hypothetical protein
VYFEGEAKKGGINVVSLMMLDLEARGYLDVNSPLKEMNYVFGKCTGQNCIIPHPNYILTRDKEVSLLIPVTVKLVT